MTAMKSYRSPKTEVRESSMIQGRGLFAKGLIKKDEIIAIKNGYILDLQEFKELDEKCRQYCLQIQDDFFLGPRTIEEIADNAIFINHSCEPNVGFDGQIIYMALRDINLGEELTHDYAMCFTNMGAFSNLKCDCGSKICRGKITGDDWKLKQLQDCYGDHFASFILRKIKSNK
ncbi:SET domain-containing protein-lysine N-methyltransferase [Candidatus Woesearchaeota archaeon]|nr:SET domain-containing protein-lysine N-methyltransferase [Candidatus Woesearchaeota archaeon]